MKCVGELLVHILVIFFGIGSWVCLNGVYVELPVLTQILPERWSLPAFIVMVSQMANIGPLLLSVKFRSKLTSNPTQLVYLIYILLTIGTVTALLTTFLWSTTNLVGETKHSVIFFVLIFFMSVVGCSSIVTFPVFVASLKQSYLISLILGEGLSGLIPSVTAIIQGIQQIECENMTVVDNVTLTVHQQVKKKTQEALFSPTTFFIIVFVIMFLSELGFVLLNVLPIAQKEKSENEKTSLLAETNVNPRPAQIFLKKRHVLILLVEQSLIASLSVTALPSIQSYSTLPYGLMAYHLTASLTFIASPLATLCSFFFRLKSISAITSVVLIICLLASYSILTAVMNLNSPLANTTPGLILIVSVWTLFSALSSYVKVNIASYFRSAVNHRSHLLWWGFITQIGSIIGALTSFVLVNYTSIFYDIEPCAVAIKTS